VILRRWRLWRSEPVSGVSVRRMRVAVMSRGVLDVANEDMWMDVLVV
jgi:hypothetical protein